MELSTFILIYVLTSLWSLSGLEYALSRGANRAGLFTVTAAVPRNVPGILQVLISIELNTK